MYIKSLNVECLIDVILKNGRISFYSPPSRSTLYKWSKDINEYLESHDFGWRVKADYKNGYICMK
jgi:hypothetical protein